MFLLNTQALAGGSWGYHVRPIHYYEPLPDFRGITADATRAAPRLAGAIDFDLRWSAAGCCAGSAMRMAPSSKRSRAIGRSV